MQWCHLLCVRRRTLFHGDTLTAASTNLAVTQLDSELCGIRLFVCWWAVRGPDVGRRHDMLSAVATAAWHLSMTTTARSVQTAAAG